MEATLTIAIGEADEKLIHHIARSQRLTDREFLEKVIGEAVVVILSKHRAEVTHRLLLAHQLDELIVSESDRLTGEGPW